MKIGLFSPYPDTLGGGERYLLTVGEYFLKKGYQVDFFSNKKYTTTELEPRFNLNLEGLNFVPDIFFGSHNFLKKAAQTKSYDLIFFLSDGSIPLSLAHKNILHFQVPFNLPSQKTFSNSLKLLKFQAIICNSKFTKHWVDQSFGVKSTVLYPPVDVKHFAPGKKTNTILSVGRFFAPSNPKKQEVMIKAFQSLCNNGLKNWDLILCGGITNGSVSSLDDLKKKIAKYPISLFPNIDFNDLRKKYSEAKIYWHAAGFGEDLDTNPERAEHFGMTTVEAMASGAVPIVYAGGGQIEIVSPKRNGFTWKTLEEFSEKTLLVAGDTNLRNQLSKNAIDDSEFFSKENFFVKLGQITGL